MQPIIKRDELVNLIPHAGLMCLHDAVLKWDKSSVLCLTQSHLSKDNPLCKNNKLSAVHAIEYGAQAMAVHGGLLAREQGKILTPGYLAAARNIELSCDYLDEIKCDLLTSATQLMVQGGSLIYTFTMYYVDNGNQYTVASGRTTIIQMRETA